ncbi:MAG TPA: flagellar hook-length control protein FliK [Vicinamibacterales bacterium]|nr:flagellar hook-length control protein FliK [Vicinamibacterales bacterium]
METRVIDFGVISKSTGESLSLGLQGGAPPAATSVGAVDFAAVMSDLAGASVGATDNLSALNASPLLATDDAARATIASSRELAALLEQIAARLASGAAEGEPAAGARVSDEREAGQDQTAKDRRHDDGRNDRLAGMLDAAPLIEVRPIAAAGPIATPAPHNVAMPAAADASPIENAPTDANRAPADLADAAHPGADDTRYAPAPGRDEIRKILAATQEATEPGEGRESAVEAGPRSDTPSVDRNPFLPLTRLIERTRAEAAEAAHASPPPVTTTTPISAAAAALADAGSADLVLRTPAAAAPPFATAAAFSDEPHAAASSTVSIVQAIRLQWSQGAGEARIQLEPEQFGSLAVTLRVVHGQVVARIESDTPAVREWLKTHQDVLHDALADRELSLEQLEIAEPEESAFSDEQRSQDDAPPEQPWHPRRWRRPDTGVQFEVVV